MRPEPKNLKEIREELKMIRAERRESLREYRYYKRIENKLLGKV